MAKKNEPTVDVDATDPGVAAPADQDAANQQQDASVQAVQDAPAGGVDVVATPSLRADGTPDQTEGFQVIDRDLAVEDVTERLRVQRVSNADSSARSALAGVGPAGVTESEVEDPTIQALKDRHENAVGDAEGDARSLVPGE